MTASSTIHSNAFNFLSYVQTGVDPRTGQYTAAISLPELKANALCGPTLPLSLNYSPLNTLDSGFGKGWNLQLSQFDPVRRVLSLASGETFEVPRGELGKKLDVPERKLETFHFYDLSATRFRVVHKSGQEEILESQGADRIALPVQVLNAQGHAITLTYTQYGGLPLLQSVNDSRGTLLRITRNGAQVNIDVHPESPLTAQFTLYLQGSDSRLMRVELPASTPGNWRFDYVVVRSLLCISEVHTPVGGVDRVSYTKAGGDSGHLFPNNVHEALPRVMSLISEPGFGQPNIEVRYDYDLDAKELLPVGKVETVNNQTQTNFLGLNAPGLAWQDDNRDNLYRASNSYRYGSTEMLWDSISNQPLRTITRRFNNFHLLVSERTEQNDHVSRSETQYHLTEGAPFDAQPPYCQLPKVQTSIWEKPKAGGDVRIDEVTTEFDTHGNLTKRANADGTLEESSWYPAVGDGQNCPPDPHGFVRHQRDLTKTPAPLAQALPGILGTAHRARLADAPTLKTRYRHAAQRPLSGAQTPWVAVIEESLDVNGEPVEQVLTDYIDTPDDPLRHGLKLKTSTTLDGKARFIDYAYALRENDVQVHQGKSSPATLATRAANPWVQQITETHTSNFDDAKRAVNSQHSLLDGQPLLERDEQNVEIQYSYDALGRVLEEIIAPGTAEQGLRRYAYSLTRATGEQATQTTWDVLGTQTVAYVDGLNRAVREARHDTLSNALKPLASRQYNLLGQETETTRHEWMQGEQPDLQLVQTKVYDSWGEVSLETAPDGVASHSENDPIHRRVTTWKTGGGKTVTAHNAFDKPVKVQRYSADASLYSTHEYAYDGLGRTRWEADAVDRETTYDYDAFDRLISTTLPDGNTIHRTFVAHSREDLPTWIALGDTLPGRDQRTDLHRTYQERSQDGLPARFAEGHTVLGHQQFDSLGRRIQTITGNRVQEFYYDGGALQPNVTVMPDGQVLNYEYKPHLSNNPTQRTAPGLEATYGYDALTAQLLSADEGQQSLTREYDGFGNLRQETRKRANGATASMTSAYSSEARLLSHTDVMGQAQTYSYQATGLARGKLASTRQGDTQTQFTYGPRGLVQKITTSSGTQRLEVTLGYDDFDREISRAFDFGGAAPAQTLTQSYNARDQLVARELKTATELLRDERFRYDSRGRLDQYQASGSQPPVDVEGKAIERQTFVFDPVDNITLVLTLFAGGNNRALYFYEEEDPTQLSRLTNSHADYAAQDALLSYDRNGNMTVDERGQALSYDALGRLTAVGNGAKASAYHYDALDILARGADDERFYCDGALTTQIRADGAHSFLRGADLLLAERRSDQQQLLATDQHSTLLATLGDNRLQSAVHNAYGYRPMDQLPDVVCGFNGEAREQGSGWYLLGNGYRAYNPVLMRFHQPDSVSPFDEGGINAYAYCVGDPINRTDPTGHASGLGIFMMVLGGIVAIVAGIAIIGLTGGAAAAAVVFLVGGIITFAFGVSYNQGPLEQVAPFSNSFEQSLDSAPPAPEPPSIEEAPSNPSAAASAQAASRAPAAANRETEATQLALARTAPKAPQPIGGKKSRWLDTTHLSRIRAVTRPA